MLIIIFADCTTSDKEDKADELNSKIEFGDAQDDLIRQKNLAYNHIQNGVDALFVTPVNTSGMDPITEAAQEAGIPVVYIDRNSYVGREDEFPEGVEIV